MNRLFAIHIIALGLLALADAGLHGEIIAPERRITWQAGVPGGIPNRTTVFCNVTNPPYNAKRDGVGQGLVHA